MTIARFPKDPNAVLDYTIDWSDWLTGTEVISLATWTLPAGITNAGDTHDATSATIFLSGGTAGVTYNVTCRITTDNSPARIDDRSITIEVLER